MAVFAVLFLSLMSAPLFFYTAVMVVGLFAGGWRLYGYYDDGRLDSRNQQTRSPHLEKQDEIVNKIKSFLQVDVPPDFEPSEEVEAKICAVVTVLLLSVTSSVLFLVIGTALLTSGILHVIELLVDRTSEEF